MRAEQAEMEIRQKQAAIIAETAVTNATTQIEALVEQTSQQQACLEQSVQQFTETVSCAQHATQTLDSLTQPLHMAAIHAVKNVESLEEALSHTRDNMAMATTAFNTSNNTLSRLTKDISETHTQRLSTLTHLTTDTSTADIQLTRLANQQQAGDALATRHHNTIDHDELAVMNNKLRTLSQNFFSVVQDNRTLMSENSALKEALSRAMPTRQLSPEDTHPNHNDTDSPFTLN